MSVFLAERNLKMSRSKVGATSEGMVPAPKEGAAEAADSAPDLFSMMKTMMNNMEQVNSCLQALDMKVLHPAGTVLSLIHI